MEFNSRDQAYTSMICSLDGYSCYGLEAKVNRNYNNYSWNW